MNNRIKELSVQADLYARADNSSMLFENFIRRYTEKFSELLIQECINVHEEHYGIDIIGDVLKEHFEIKE